MTEVYEIMHREEKVNRKNTPPPSRIPEFWGEHWKTQVRNERHYYFAQHTISLWNSLPQGVAATEINWL